MLRLLHTADLHLDSRFTGSGLGRDKVMQRHAELLDVLRGIAALAREREADALLIAGDLFEDEYVARSTLERAFAEIRELAPMPVFISPGNHDPALPGSPYLTDSLPPNLKVFADSGIERVDLEGKDAAVFGLGFTSRHERSQLLKGFSVEGGAAINVLLAHGAVFLSAEGQASDYNPIDPADLRACGADYCALGHYHRAQDVWTDARGLRAAYPGSPEPMRFGHEGEFGVLLVEIEAGGPISIERIQTQKRSYYGLDLDISGCGDAAGIDREILRALSDPRFEGGLVELTLRGTVQPDFSFDAETYAGAISRFFNFRLDDRTVPDFDLEAISSEGTARGAFCRVMIEAIEAEENEAERRVRERALWLGLAAFEGVDVGELPL